MSILRYDCVFIISLVVQLCNVHGVIYTAGVVEYKTFKLLPSETPKQLLLRNAEKYVEIIAKAALHDVDIIVFPEAGLTSTELWNTDRDREDKLPFLTEIPAVGINPCDLTESPELLVKLSCAAKENRMYVVFNLGELAHCTPGEHDCTSDGNLYYNTNVAIDRNGTIVSRYRKFNLYYEEDFNTTKTPDHSWFDTDFGVKFGMFICADILYKQPTFGLINKLNISNFAYPTAWFSEVPLLSAVGIQAGWSYDLDVNLLASGYSNVTNKNRGSGIYAGRDGVKAVIMPQQSTTALLISKLSSDQRGVDLPSHQQIIFSEDKSSNFEVWGGNLENYTTILVTSQRARLEYENEGFICSITAEVSTLKEGVVYRLIAHSAQRDLPDMPVEVEVCGVVACRDSNLSTCDLPSLKSSGTVFSKIVVTASSEKSLVNYPITVKQNLLPFHKGTFKYSKLESDGKYKFRMETSEPLSNYIAFALYRNS